ncbi:MAG: LLM class flavin-dependent oxidoreductase, partial [Rhodanobacter sp.]
FVNLRRGRPGLVPAPVDDIESFWTPLEKQGVEHALACAVVGNTATVQQGIATFIARNQPDELLLTANIFDHSARRYSFEIAAAVHDQLANAG